MKIDSHQHFWKFNSSEYRWIDESMKILQRDYLPPDLEPLLKQEGFDGCIAVQARQSIDETHWLIQLANENSWIKGVVGWVDLCSPDIDKQLAELSQNRKLVGVRQARCGAGAPQDRY